MSETNEFVTREISRKKTDVLVTHVSEMMPDSLESAAIPISCQSKTTPQSLLKTYKLESTIDLAPSNSSDAWLLLAHKMGNLINEKDSRITKLESKLKQTK